MMFLKKILLVLAITLLAIVNTSFGAWYYWQDNDPCSNSWLVEDMFWPFN